MEHNDSPQPQCSQFCTLDFARHSNCIALQALLAGRVEEALLNESVPRKLGRYRPIALIAKGGMGEAYLATIDDEGSFNRLVVVKVLREDLSSEPEFVAMFRDEARVAAGLTHPNVVQTHEFGFSDGHYYIVMDFVDGQPLKHLAKLPPNTFPIGFS